MPTYETPDDWRAEKYVADVLEALGWEVWRHNDTSDPRYKKLTRVQGQNGWDMTILNRGPGTPRKLKRPYVPVEVKRRDMDWATDHKDGIVLDFDKVVAMRMWSDAQPRVRNNYTEKLKDPRYSALAHEQPRGPVMFIVVPNDLSLRKVWIGHDRIGEWKTGTFAATGRPERQVFYIPKDHFTHWDCLGIAYPES